MVSECLFLMVVTSPSLCPTHWPLAGWESMLFLRAHKLISLSQKIDRKQAGLVHSIAFIRKEIIPLFSLIIL